MAKLTKKARKALEIEFSQYISAIEFSECQIRKLTGEKNSVDLIKEEMRLGVLKEEQRKIGAQL